MNRIGKKGDYRQVGVRVAFLKVPSSDSLKVLLGFSPYKELMQLLPPSGRGLG